MATQQPIWKHLDSADFYRIFEDTTGVYEPEVEIREEIEDEPEDHGGRVELYRFTLERLKVVDGYLVGMRYDPSWPHPVASYEEWFAKDLKGVASCNGTTKEELIKELCDEDARKRFHAYYSIGTYYGLNNFDAYPLTMTGDELDARWSDKSTG